MFITKSEKGGLLECLAADIVKSSCMKRAGTFRTYGGEKRCMQGLDWET